MILLLLMMDLRLSLIMMKIYEKLNDVTNTKWNKKPEDCTNHEIYYVMLEMTNKLCRDLPKPQGDRKLYYFSAEFLVGKLLSNNLLALGIFEETEKVLESMEKKLSEIEEYEPEPSLGNGGLGRLAACFLDSIAALGLNGDGVGLNYHYGLFRQRFVNNNQQENPDPWIENESWLEDTGVSFEVPFGGFTQKAIMKDILVPGAGSKVANRLHLFDVEEPKEFENGGIDFDKNDISHCLTSFLYPDDRYDDGKLLRVYQQYFMVSAGAQLILKELEDNGFSFENISKHVVIQINDTHPSMVIPELIRLLVEKGLTMDKAVEEVSKTCAYTNHTILAEALEKWPISYIEKVAPQIVPIIKELDARARKVTSDNSVEIIHDGWLVNMAHMDMHFGFSVNGVAYLHTEILKNTELNNFYKLYPEKFNNKTNGITFRRWLQVCNQDLSELITEYIGDSWKNDAEDLKKLMDYSEDEEFLNKLLEVKHKNKIRLKEQLLKTSGVEIDENSIYDIQVKRLHEYKRQQMNLLYVIYKYIKIKNGEIPKRPITVIFGAKAAPAYDMAKNIIHLILCMQSLIENDPSVNKWLKVVMIENYNVTWAQSLIPACDISEQISLASKEASGTGNMKFMANGGITLGTMDGANVEIAQLVGEDNIYTFGKSSDEVIELYKNSSYRAVDFYHKPELEYLVDFIVSPELLSIGNPQMLSALWRNIKYEDYFKALLDTEEYIKVREKAYEDYEDRISWAKKMTANIANSGYFSSDRTISEYNKDIWKLK